MIVDSRDETALSYLHHPGEAMTRAEADLLKELEERLRFETLLADISARFVNLPSDQIDGEIKKVSPDKERGFS
jgi:hypothetical protein